MKKYIRQNRGTLIVTIAIGVLYSVMSAFFAIIVQQLIDIAVKEDIASFVRMVIFTCVYILFCGCIHLFHATLCKKIICRITQALRFDIFRGVFKRNMSDFKSVNSADYISALTNDIKLIEDNYCIPLLQGLSGAVELAASAAILIYFSPIIFITLVMLIILLTVIPGLFNKVLEKRQSNFSNKMAELTILIKDFLSGFEVITSYRMTLHTEQSFGDENKTTTKSKYAVDSVTAAVESVSTVLGSAVLIVIFCVAVYLIIKGYITVGVLVGVLQVSGQIVNPIQILSQSVPKIQGTKSVIKRLTDLREYQRITLTGDKEPVFNNEITVRDIYFKYENGNEVLRGVTCQFKKDKKYAIIGKSGCGKTTLINLLNGCFDNYKGEILFDGTELHSLKIERVNEIIAVIHQNVYVFDETIRNNICLYKDVPNDTLKLVLARSGVDTFLDDTRTIDTDAGENGANLSGGQRQRIAVARALAQNNPILILDEGTSAIDMQTAYDIESRLLQLDNLTLITITHSLNPELLKSYDRIIFMEEGQICESGTFEELISAKAAFYDFYNVKTK
jgi:ABC-type multidrug transport system fused ATPase/permease subunit